MRARTPRKGPPRSAKNARRCGGAADGGGHGGRLRRLRRRDAAGPDRELLGLLRRLAARGAAGGRRRADRRADRGLPGRTDHADPGEGAAEGPRRRLREDLPGAAGTGPGHVPGPADQDRSQRRRAQPGRPRGGGGQGRRPARASASRCVRHRGRPARADEGPAGGRAQPRQHRHRAAAGRRRRRAGHGPRLPPLAAGADVVICPRVTDAALTSGPAAWWHGWGREDWDALAGAVVAGHVIECGPQACGGNYPFLDEITDRRYPGFPIAEVSADGSSVITKHDGTGWLVSAGTVTAQLLYEIAGPD